MAAALQEPSRAPSHKPLAARCSRGGEGGRPEQRGRLPRSLPTPRRDPRPSPQSPAQLSSPIASGFLPHLDSQGRDVGNDRSSPHFSEGAGLLGKNKFIFGSGRELCSHTFVSVPLPPCSAGIFPADPQKQRLLPQAPRTLLEEPTYTLISLGRSPGTFVTKPVFQRFLAWVQLQQVVPGVETWPRPTVNAPHSGGARGQLSR